MHPDRNRARCPLASLRERRIRREMDRLVGEITRRRAADPECLRFDEREPLYVRFHELRGKLAA